MKFLTSIRFGCYHWLPLAIAGLCLSNTLRAHPLLDAAGFTQTQCGAGGREIAVTHHGATGPGSLPHGASNATGPRIIAFKVAGGIDLDKRIIHTRQPYLTIYGETAPSPRITLLEGNAAFDLTGRSVRIRTPGVRPLRKTPSWSEALSPIAVAIFEEHIPENTDARPWDRDAIEQTYYRLGP
jgi:hypothetical protein